jgi:hypothetical protein
VTRRSCSEQQIQRAAIGVEEWRAIPSWGGYYEASDLGRIRRVRRARGTKAGRILKTFVTPKGYAIAQLTAGSIRRTVGVSRLVAEAFCPEFDPERQVDHIDGCRTDNRPSNLRMATGDQNAKNRGTNKNSSLGVKGVSFRSGRFVARIQVDKRRIKIGYFRSQAEAVAAYKAAERFHYGQFARGYAHAAP